MFRICFKIIFITVFIFILAVSVLTIDGLMDDVHPADVIVVLGNKINSDGTPSKRLQARLNKAIQLYEQKNSSLIIVSGGTGKEGFDEAKVMKEYLVNKNIPAESVFEDNKGVDSFETSKNTKIFMEEKDLSSVLLVTNYYHVSRTRLALKKTGIEEIYSAHANYFEIRDFYSIPREVIGYMYYLLRK
jgi:vancomycin permeability regulator SanA